MHKIYETDDVFMGMKKRYCPHCGQRIVQKSTERLIKRSDPDHSFYCNIGISTKLHNDILVIGKEYFCLKCKKSFSCQEIQFVYETQKKIQKKIVSNEEIEVIKNKKLKRLEKIKQRMELFLLLPGLGTFICLYYMNKNNKRNLHNKESGKLLIFSFFLSLLLALLFKYIFSSIEKASSVVEKILLYKNYIIAFLSLYCFNLPSLWFIIKLKKKPGKCGS